MTDRADDIARRASDNRFRRDRGALTAALARLLGEGQALKPLADADRAATVAGEARAGHRAAEEHPWALVRREWSADNREAVVSLAHAISAHVGSRPVWLVVPGREPQAVAIGSDVVLDNPLGFAALSMYGYELVVLDQQVPAGLWLGRHEHHYGPDTTRHTWEVEVWGTEPWLSAAARAVREQGQADADAG